MNSQVIIFVFAFVAFCLATSGGWQQEPVPSVSELSCNSKPDKPIVTALDARSATGLTFNSN
jgi:hypothetical protein